MTSSLAPTLRALPGASPNARVRNEASLSGMVGLVQRDRIRVKDAANPCGDAQAVLGDRVATVPSAPVLDAAVRRRMSTHDTELVVLARRLGGSPVTVDQEILTGAPGMAVPL